MPLLTQHRDALLQVGKRRIVLRMNDRLPVFQSIQAPLRFCQPFVGIGVGFAQTLDIGEDVVFLMLHRHNVVALAECVDRVSLCRDSVFKRLQLAGYFVVGIGREAFIGVGNMLPVRGGDPIDQARYKLLLGAYRGKLNDLCAFDRLGRQHPLGGGNRVRPRNRGALRYLSGAQRHPAAMVGSSGLVLRSETILRRSRRLARPSRRSPA